MSYTKTTDFAAKDVLVAGDPLKLIKGVELGAEFDAIQAADALNMKSATLAATGGSDLVGFIQSGTGASTSLTVQDKLRETVSVKDFGAVGDGVTDDTEAVQAAIDAVGAAGGGVIDGVFGTYCIDSSNGCVVNYDDVLLKNFVFKRTNSSNPGYTLRFATTGNVSGGGVIDSKFIGIPTLAANAGLLMGESVHYANNYILDNIEAIDHGQYGVGIENGNDWKVNNIRVIDHGLTSGTISSCMGFYVYPKLASSGGQLSNISSQISDACVANASANTAAIKLQTHQRLVANNIRAIYGREQCMAIDSVNGIISNVFVKQQSNSFAGLAVGNSSPDHIFSGQTFTLDGFVIEFATSANINEFVIGGGVDGVYELTDCVIRNGKGGGASFLAYSNLKNCVFENLSFQDIRFSSAQNGYAVNSSVSTGNIFKNVTVSGGSMSGIFSLETSNSSIISCGSSAVDGDTVSSVVIRGSDNIIQSLFVNNCSSNAVQIIGSNNEIYDTALNDITGYTIWFPSGSDDNNVYSGSVLARKGTGILNSGTNNLVYDINPTVGDDVGDANATATWTSGIRTFVWSSPITTNRTLTLSTGSTPNGAKYRVIRNASATGAFNLNVGTGPLKALSAGQWCDVEYNGSAWVLSAFGSL